LRIGDWKFVICHLSIVAMTPRDFSDRLWQFAARIAKEVDVLPDNRPGRAKLSF
jgi:hypothetical protein